MKTYLVGGAVRDLLLGLEPKDRDYVVVGETVQAMLDQGFRQVGKDFPVFLHPITHEEYALARVERKTGVGHTGFAVETANVTLEDDLSRRDLTINSMAMGASGELVDPFGGRGDLESKVLRHTSDAFLEDPLRVLRVARFMARFGPGWTIDSGLRQTMSRMVASGALEELPFERIWVELRKGLLESHPASMVSAMLALGLLQRPRALPGLVLREEYEGSLARAAALGVPLEVRFACAFKLDGTTVSEKLPKEVSDVAMAAQRAEDQGIREFDKLDLERQLALLEGQDVLRRPSRLKAVIAALQLLHPFEVDRLAMACEQFGAINYQALAEGRLGMDIKQAVRDQKLAVLQALQATEKRPESFPFERPTHQVGRFFTGAYWAACGVSKTQLYSYNGSRNMLKCFRRIGYGITIFCTRRDAFRAAVSLYTEAFRKAKSL